MNCKHKCKHTISYDFEHPVSIYPVKDTFHVGDTLWIDIHFSDIVKDLRSGNSFKLVNFDFQRCYIRLFQISDTLVNAFSQNKAWNDFNEIIYNGNIVYTWLDGLEYKYDYINNQYLFKVGIIMQDTGKYIYDPFFANRYPAAHDNMNFVSVTGGKNCEIINDIWFPVNRQTDGTYKNNYHLFQKFMNEKLENDIERIKTNTFTFVVVK